MLNKSHLTFSADESLTAHFKLKEFINPYYLRVEQLNTFETSNLCKVANALEIVRSYFGHKPIVITSGFRTIEQNKQCGGSENSYHLQGLAADFYINGVAPHVIAAYIADHVDFAECISYTSKGFVHLALHRNQFDKKHLFISKK